MHAAAAEKAQRQAAAERAQTLAVLREIRSRTVGPARFDQQAREETVGRLYTEDVGRRSARTREAVKRAVRRIDAEKLCTLTALTPDLKTLVLRRTPTRWGGTQPSLEPTRLRLLGKQSLELPPAEWRRTIRQEQGQPAWPAWSLEAPGTSAHDCTTPQVYQNALLQAGDADAVASRRPQSARACYSG